MMFLQSLHSKEEIRALKMNHVGMVSVVFFLILQPQNPRKYILENVSQSLICECPKDSNKEKLS